MNITDILNATDIIEITPVKFIEAANINVATPMLVMFYLISVLIFSIVGFSLVKQDRQKLLVILGLSALLMLAVLFFMITVPHFFIDISTKFMEFFN